MKQALEQPGTSSGKRHQHRLFTREELLEQIYDSEEDECEFDEEYPFSSESDESEEESIVRSRSRNTSRSRSVHQEPRWGGLSAAGGQGW